MPAATAFQQSDQTRRLFVDQQEESGAWREQRLSAAVVGLTRDVVVYRAARKSSWMTHQYHGSRETFCPPMWWDLGIGSGACGLGCRACFLMLTFRAMRDPLRHLLYDNVEKCWSSTRCWLASPSRRPQHTLGLGIDRSDSLLYEGVTEHAQHLIPMFARPSLNPQGCRLVLLTKSKNVGYLEGLPTTNTVVTFSLNPEPIADLWEGKWPDTHERITPPINERLDACRQAQQWGFETRWRIDPVLTPPGWRQAYEEFFAEAASLGLRPRYITLGTYREKNPQLDTWRKKWGLPAMEWQPDGKVKEGTHYHVPAAERREIYQTIAGLCRQYLPTSRISLCKETHALRKQLGLCNADCNCLV